MNSLDSTMAPGNGALELARRVLDSVPVIAFSVDAEWRLQLLEGAGARIEESLTASLVGVDLRELLANMPDALLALERALMGEQFTQQIAIGDRILEARFSPTQDSEGRCLGTGGVAIEVTEQVRVEARLQRRVDLEHQISQLSHYFLSLAPDRLTEAVQSSMEKAAELARADQTCLFVSTPTGPEPFVRYDWSNSDDPSLRAPHDAETLSHFLYSAKLLAEGKVINIASAAELPDVARYEREDMARRGVTSALSIPLRVGQRVVGFQIFEHFSQERRWSEEEIALLGLLGEIFARAVERQHADAALGESEERFRALSENMTDLVVELDEGGTVTWASPSFVDLLGREPQTLLGGRLDPILHPEDADIPRRQLHRAYANEPPSTCVYRLQHEDQRWLWFEATGRAYRTRDDELRFVSLARDITGQKALLGSLERQRQADREITELSRRFLELSPTEIDDGIRAGLEDAVRMAGADRGYLLGLNQEPLFQAAKQPWSDADLERMIVDHANDGYRKFRWSAERVIRGQVVQIASCDALAAQGVPEGIELVARGVRSLLGVPILSGDRMVGYLGLECTEAPREWSEREMTEMQMVAGIFSSALQRRSAELALAQQVNFEHRISELSHRFLAVPTQGLEGAIVEVLGETADLAGADRAYLLAFGDERDPLGDAQVGVFDWSSEGVEAADLDPEAYGAAWFLKDDILHVPDVDRLTGDATQQRDLLEARGVRSLLGIPVRSTRGYLGFLSFECHDQPRKWTHEEITLFRLLGELFGSALRRLQAERALGESREQLRHAQKMEAVGRLAGGIAHDFNNLLTVILGFSRAALRDLEPGNSLKEDMQEINGAAERAASLTKQLLSFSRREPRQARGLDLNQVVLGVQELIRRLLGTDIELKFELGADLCEVHCDPSQLEQLLVNLAVNARDAMPSGGRITMRTSSRELSPADCRRLGIEGPGIYGVLEVTDTGDGMASEVLEHIFEPFYTTKAPGKGTGLGLSIAYSVVEEYGGGIKVQSEPGRGTRFTVYLPEPSEHEEGDPEP